MHRVHDRLSHTCRTRRFERIGVIGLAGLIGCAVASAQQPSRPAVKRAVPPITLHADADGVFFPDAFSTLKGPRPSSWKSADRSALPRAEISSVNAGPGTGEPGSTGVAWSRMLPAEVIENEIKAQKIALDAAITTPSEFAGNGYRAARQHFSMLAAMFGIVEQYDADIRWKRDARGARDLFAQAARNCKAGSANVFNAAKLRKAELQDIVGGGTLASVPAEAGESNWGDWVDRGPLMQRLQVGYHERVMPWLSSGDEFRAHGGQLQAECEIIAGVSTILIQEGMDDASDDSYADYCRQLHDSAIAIKDAVKLKSYDQARQASGQILKSCDECHALYRG
ncbi:MAG: hypothetical protein R3E01_15200 [Pirellulaceae bacterium]|nr:hypothetical protein [Planctomycetales bacterium]